MTLVSLEEEEEEEEEGVAGVSLTASMGFTVRSMVPGMVHGYPKQGVESVTPDTAFLSCLLKFNVTTLFLWSSQPH